MDGKGKRWRDGENGCTVKQRERLLQPKPEAAFLWKSTTQRRKRDKRPVRVRGCVLSFAAMGE
jgi:hypothetical protein